MNKTEQFDHFAGNLAVSENLKQRSIRAVLFMATGGGADFLLRFVSIIVLARLLIPEDFGLVAMVTAVTGMVEGVRDLGLSTATVQRSDISEEQVSQLFWINVAAGTLFFFAFCAGSTTISAFYGDVRIVPLTMAISTNFLWGGLTVQHEALLTRQLKQGELSLIRLGANLLSLVTAVILAVGGYGFWALVWREVVRSILIALGVWLRCPWVPRWPSRGAKIRGLLRFGRNLSLASFIGLLISKVDGLLIGKFFGAVPLGNFRQAQQLLVAPLEQISVPIYSVAQPALSRLQSDPERYRRFYERMVFFVSLVTIPLGIFVGIYSEEITLVVLGEKWIDSAVFLRIFAMAAAIGPAIGTSGIVLVTCGKTGRLLVITLVGSLLRSILVVIGLQWGAEGIAIAMVSSLVVLAVPRLYCGFLGTPVTVRLWLKATGTPLTSGVFMMGALIVLHTLMPLNGVVQCLALGTGVGALVYFSVLFLLPKGRREVKILLRDIVSAMRRESVPGSKERLEGL